MTVLAFSRSSVPPPQGWRSSEFQAIAAACAGAIARGQACGLETGATECGDPQLYLMDGARENDCILCVSRIGRLYVIEDGAGRVLFEHDSLMPLAEQMRAALSRRKAAIGARLLVAWCAIREAFEERLDPLWGEPAELLAELAPTFAAFA